MTRHVKRLNKERLPKVIKEYELTGKGKSGRLKKNGKKDLKSPYVKTRRSIRQKFLEETLEDDFEMKNKIPIKKKES